MKIKKDPPKPGGIFGGVVFAMVLGSIPFKQKEALRKKITVNGGTISYLVTKKCNFVICEADKDASNYGLKTAQRLGIPIISSSYVDMCLAEKKLVSTNICSQEQDIEKLRRLDDEFKTGNVSVNFGNEPLNVGSNNSRFGITKQLKHWSFMDNKGPDFHNHPYNVAKFTILKGVPRRNGEVPFCVMEIQTLKVDEKSSIYLCDSEKFCVFIDSGILFDANTINKGIKSSVQTCRFTNSRNAALDCYSQLHKNYTSPPHTLSSWPRNEAIPPYIGSPEFLKICESWVLTNSNLDEEVRKLVVHLWKECYKYLENVLDGNITDIKLNDMNKAESILVQLRKEVTDESIKEVSRKMRLLSKDYYNLIHQKTQEMLTSRTAISYQHQLLQLIRDVLAVSEGNLHEMATDSILTLYKSLACWITHIKADSEEFITVKEKVISSQSGNSKHNLEVRNIFAVKRPAEDIGFANDMCNHQYLFHGTEAHSILGILSRGLLLHKNDYAEDGKINLLGSGIYFSPSSSASARYSSASKTTGARFLLFVEVALGKCFATEKTLPELIEPPKGFQSVQGIPCESPTSSEFQDIEYAVFHEGQQRLAYLIEFSLQNENLHISPNPAVFVPEIPMEVEHSVISQGVSAYDAFDEIMFAKDKKAQYGLQGVASNPIPLESVHIRAHIVDLASKVVIFQEYHNSNCHSVEAKYVFPLDDLAAVCGFEAFINEKHVVGVIQEKKAAHKQYHEAIAEGHGAYLMDESGQDIFTITVGNLPAYSRVVIKITYVAELKTENEHIVFDLSRCAIGNSNEDCTMLQNSITPISFGAPSLKSSLQIGIEMPFDIRRIVSPNHSIITKKTDTMATVKLCKGQNIANGFQLWIDLAEVHVPRMWVEISENDEEVEACMLAFYPVFSDEARETETVIIMIDASNSMQMNAFKSAQTVALLTLHHMKDNWKFNVVFFGSIYEELFPVPQMKTTENSDHASKFILEAKPNFGCTDLPSALRSCFLLSPPCSEGPQNIFLVSDGNINNAALVLQNAAKYSSETRIFTFGVGSLRLPCNQHLMKNLANKAAGAYEYFDEQMKYKWRNKVKQQLYKASQPALTDIRVEWQQLDDDPIPPVQAPQKILSLFNGTRQVIYGFVAHCSMATLTAKVNNTTLSTVVSTSEVSKSKGHLLHSLTAKAIIRDWSDGIIDEDASKDEATKTSMKSYITSLSQKHGILSSLTSYIAIEKRNEDYTGSLPCRPLVLDLVNNEDVDKLSYIEYDDVEEPNVNDVEESIVNDVEEPNVNYIVPALITSNPSEEREIAQPVDKLKKGKKKKKGLHTSHMLFGAQQSKPVVSSFCVAEKLAMTEEKIDSLHERTFSSCGQMPATQSFGVNMPTFNAPVKLSITNEREVAANDMDKGQLFSFGSAIRPHQSITLQMAANDVVKPVPFSPTIYSFCSASSNDASYTAINTLKLPTELSHESIMTDINEELRFKDSGDSVTMTDDDFILDDGFVQHDEEAFKTSETFHSDDKVSSLQLANTLRMGLPPPPSWRFDLLSKLKGAENVSAKMLNVEDPEDLVRMRLPKPFREHTLGDMRGRMRNLHSNVSRLVQTSVGSTASAGHTYHLPGIAYHLVSRRAAPRDEDEENSKCHANQVVMRSKPIEEFIINGKGNLPLCFALIKAISNCPRTSTWSNNIWALLKEGSMFKECELLALQSELDSLATKDSSETGKSHSTTNDIWKHQTAHGYFTMDCLDQCIHDGYASKITKILDDAGLLSLGGKREEVLRMCATIAAGLVFWKKVCEVTHNEEIYESGVVSEKNIQQLFSTYLLWNFNAKSVVALLKAFAYILWVYKRNPLLFRSLELGLKEKVCTWEALLLFYFTR